MLNTIVLLFVKELLEASPRESHPEIVSDEDTPRKGTEVLSDVHHETDIQLGKDSFHHDIISEQHMSLQVITQTSEIFYSEV
jgi:hypothetical protein